MTTTSEPTAPERAAPALELSALRRELFERIDALQDELARRYKAGSTDVSEVLPRDG
jgi:hypothetical protein